MLEAQDTLLRNSVDPDLARLSLPFIWVVLAWGDVLGGRLGFVDCAILNSSHGPEEVGLFLLWLLLCLQFQG